MKSIKRKRKNSSDKKAKFNVMAVPCNRPFIVSAEKAEDFLKQSMDPEIKKQIHEMAAEFEKNNLRN